MTRRSAHDVGHLLRELAPQVLATLTRRHGDFGDAEDAVQEAMIAAASQWPSAGLPDNPRGWLYQVARRKLTDLARSDIARRRREDAVAIEYADDARAAWNPTLEIGVEQDDVLALLFMCCHPSLTDASAIALTLRAVAGLTTAEIARAFLVPEATMAQRISRAKQTIRSSDVPFEVPAEREIDARLLAVKHVLYLIFNEGYASSGGDALTRDDLANEAIRVTRLVRDLLPNDGEVEGLLALMLLTDARRCARTGTAGEIIPLDEQDRSAWERAEIEEGIAMVTSAMSRGGIGPYRVQAAIAALHDEAPSTEATDWPQILALYGVLRSLGDNPMVALNEAIAAAMVHGPARGLEMLSVLDGDERIAKHYRLDVVRAHLYERAGDDARALAHYRSAAERTASAPERDYLLLRAARVSSRMT